MLARIQVIIWCAAYIIEVLCRDSEHWPLVILPGIVILFQVFSLGATVGGKGPNS
jgi:hypothetical protein